jgi:hypothetical protein
MLRTGLEPARPKGQGILSPLCLPIPPPELIQSMKSDHYKSASILYQELLSVFNLKKELLPLWMVKGLFSSSLLRKGVLTLLEVPQIAFQKALGPQK